MKHPFHVFFILCFSFISCKETQIENPELSQYGIELGLQLDQGKKWIGNPETTFGVKKMEGLVANFDPNSNPEGWMELQNNLRSAFDEIFRECTMEGEGHEQLHVYLIPLMELFNALGNEDSESRYAAFETLEKHLPVYWEYFE